MSAPTLNTSNRLVVKATIRTPEGEDLTIQGEHAIAFRAGQGCEVIEVTGRSNVLDRLSSDLGWNNEHIE